MRKDFLSVLRIKNFLIFTSGQTISQFGEKLVQLALIALVGVYAKGSPAALSKLAVSISLPVILFAPLVGIAVDRLNRKKAIIFSELGRALLILTIPLVIVRTHSLSVIYMFAFFIFLSALIFNTSKLSIIPNLVPTDKLLGANSVCSFAVRTATLVGLLGGGYLIDWCGWQKSFYINSLFFICSAFIFTQIFVSFKNRTRSELTFFSDLKEGFTLVFKERKVLFVMGVSFFLCLVGASIYVLIINIVQQELGKGTGGVGILGGVLAIGALISAFLFGMAGRRLKKTKVILFAFLILGIIFVGFSLCKNFIFFILLSFLGGIAMAPITISQDTILHETLEEKIRGRIFGIKDWILNLFFAISSATLGIIATVTSVRTTLSGMGCLIVVLSVLGMWRIRK